jgi:hypothetical protein
MHASIDNMQIYFLFHQKPIKKHFFCSNIQESHLTAEKNLLYEVSLVRKNENQLLSKLFLRFGDIEMMRKNSSLALRQVKFARPPSLGIQFCGFRTPQVTFLKNIRIYKKAFEEKPLKKY